MENIKTLNIIQNEKNNKCVMCEACYYVCEHHAIEYVFDKNLFEHKAVINNEKCQKCFKCINICPVNCEKDVKQTKDSYVAYTEDDVRLNSSSGGIFPIIAEYFLDNGGYVIGAGWKSSIEVEHIVVKEKSQLPLILGTKYFKSDTSKIYLQVKKYLEDGKRILFCGTPCQVVAIKNLFSQYNTLLYTVDLICHGVPKNYIVKNYLKRQLSLDNKNIKDVKKIKFRDKLDFPNYCNRLKIEYRDHSEYIGEYEKNDIFEKLYHDGVSIRESCLNCKFAKFPRVGDISLGDAWDAIYDENSELHDIDKGISQIIINSFKGNEIFNGIKLNLAFYQKTEIKGDSNNRFSNALCYDQKKREHFYFKLIKGDSFEESYKHTIIKPHYDIGLVGCWGIENYGSNMTYYALYKYLVLLGYDVLMIERPNSAEWKPHPIPYGFKNNPYPSFALSPIYSSKQEMKKLNDICSVFILGSDQLLYHDLYRLFDEYVDMRYVFGNKTKIAYSTSLGRKHFEGTDMQRATLSLFLQKFDAISIREESTIPNIEEEFGIKAVWMPDPVFLLSQLQYNLFMEIQSECDDIDYIGGYILDPNVYVENLLLRISDEKEMKLKLFSDYAYKEKLGNLEYNIAASNEEWLSSIKKCKYFITDSFHGTCFAIIFNKPFICIANKKRGYERFFSLLSHFGLLNCMVEDIEHLDVAKFNVINYAEINNIIAQDRMRAEGWLRKNIISVKRACSDYDILDLRIDDLDLRLDCLNNRFKACFGEYQETRQHVVSTEDWLLNTHNRLNLLEKERDDLVKYIEELQSSNDYLRQIVDKIDNRFYKRIYKKITHVFRLIKNKYITHI